MTIIRDKEYFRKAWKKWKKNNPEKIKEHDRKSYLKNKEKKITQVRLNNLLPKIPTVERLNVIKKFFKNGCEVCGWKEERGLLEVHHIKPRASGGKEELENYKVLCPNHHRLAHFKNRTTLSKLLKDCYKI